ncbi:MAG: SDR family oxidoreductase [Candidatus Pedobacter colombiensis]|uniref:dTDP-4-dehydrorhamnose reductase n=1 Tax=Candidatus Pedobacter colombiensis TaxID=3121371 RepID=A0AAJ6B907_9SPHI|nr:SDR family oxidoreductase [Pedobacter sp.]WEK19683.1 MAG: SDR family oxidoreductase [Pedobacter sp.]
MEQVKKVLIIGSKGMAGHVIYNFLKINTAFDVIDIARRSEFHIPNYELDITDFFALSKVFEKERPNYVINCIGVLNKDAEDHPDKAVLLNSYFPHFLAKCGNELRFRVIHISTDCVFNGKKGGYDETSEKDGIGFYAQSKALGEIAYGNNLTIRTSIIGPELKSDGIGLFNWFMQQSGQIKGYRQAFWTGVTTIQLAKAIVAAINQNLTGLHHLVNGMKINKYDLTNIFRIVFHKNDITIEPYDDYKVDKSLLKTDDTFKHFVPSYELMIEEMKEWMLKFNDLYSHYKF